MSTQTLKYYDSLGATASLIDRDYCIVAGTVTPYAYLTQGYYYPLIAQFGSNCDVNSLDVYVLQDHRAISTPWSGYYIEMLTYDGN